MNWRADPLIPHPNPLVVVTNIDSRVVPSLIWINSILKGSDNRTILELFEWQYLGARSPINGIWCIATQFDKANTMTVANYMSLKWFRIVANKAFRRLVQSGLIIFSWFRCRHATMQKNGCNDHYELWMFSHNHIEIGQTFSVLYQKPKKLAELHTYVTEIGLNLPLKTIFTNVKIDDLK